MSLRITLCLGTLNCGDSASSLCGISRHGTIMDKSFICYEWQNYFYNFIFKTDGIWIGQRVLTTWIGSWHTLSVDVLICNQEAGMFLLLFSGVISVYEINADCTSFNQTVEKSIVFCQCFHVFPNLTILVAWLLLS